MVSQMVVSGIEDNTVGMRHIETAETRGGVVSFTILNRDGDVKWCAIKLAL